MHRKNLLRLFWSGAFCYLSLQALYSFITSIPADKINEVGDRGGDFISLLLLAIAGGTAATFVRTLIGLFRKEKIS